jgi:hypothetical protein
MRRSLATSLRRSGWCAARGDALVVDVDPGAADVVAAVVDAERLCCSALDWHLDTGSTVRLRVEAKPMQLDAREAIFSSSYPGR